MPPPARLALLTKGHDRFDIAEAEARVEEQRASMANAVRTADRMQNLRTSGAQSQRAVDDAIAQRNEIAARLRAVEQVLAGLKRGYRTEEIARDPGRLRTRRGGAGPRQPAAGGHYLAQIRGEAGGLNLSASGRLLQILDHRREKPHGLPPGDAAMVEGQRQRNAPMCLDPVLDRHHIARDASGTEDGNRGRHNDRRGIPASHDAEVRQHEGEIAQIRGWQRAVTRTGLQSIHLGAQCRRVAIADIADHRHQQAIRCIPPRCRPGCDGTAAAPGCCHRTRH